MSRKFFVAWFAFCGLMSVGALAFAGWAVYTVVMWLTAQ